MYYIFINVLALFVLGLPLSVLLSFKDKSQKSVLEIFILTATTGPLIINYLIFTFGYANLLSSQNIILATVVIVVVPLFSKSVRKSIGDFCLITRERLHKVKSNFGRLEFHQAFPLSLIIFTLGITAYSAFFLSPQLRDPHAVWLFYGKKIFETKSIPLFYGNGYDISWSGNYPPLYSFLAGYYFIILDKAIPQAFSPVAWLYGALTFLATFLFAKELGLEKEALLATSLLATSSLFTLELTNYGYVTIAWTFYVVTTCFYLVRLLKEKTAFTEIAFGLSLGALLLSTYLSLIFAASLIALILMDISIKKVFKIKTMLESKPLTSGLIIAFLLLFPWLARNYILLRNPVYPWFPSILDGKGIDLSVINLVPETHRIYPLHNLLVDNTFSALSNEDLGYTLLVIGTISAVYLVLQRKGMLPLLGKLTLSFFTFLVASMIVIHGYERYFLMATPLLAISAAYLLHRIFSSNRLKILTVVAIIIFSSPNYVYLISLAPKGASFYETKLLYYIEDYIDECIPLNATILTNEIQLYFLNRKVIDIYNIPEVLEVTSLSELVSILKIENITHILTNDNIDIEYLGNMLFWSYLKNESAFEVLIDMHPYTLYAVKNGEN